MKNNKFKFWQPFDGYVDIEISDDYEAIMYGINNQLDIFTFDGKLVYSPNDDEDSNLWRLSKYGVTFVDDKGFRIWQRTKK